MFKRFVIGFVVGMGAVYWYINSSDPLRMQIQSWFTGHASDYKGDRSHQAARDLLDAPRR